MLAAAETGPAPLNSHREMAIERPHCDQCLDAIGELSFPDPTWLVAFVVTSEAGSFCAAAAELETTDKCVRHRVGQLEKHLGIRLLDRSRRGARLSSDGRGVYFAARAALAPLSAMAKRGRRARSLARYY